MRGKWISIGVLVGVVAGLVNTSSCARSQTLESITLSPAGGFVFEGFGAAAQFTAYGNFIHPPETKDVTDKVTWSLDVQNFGNVNQQGVVTYTRTDGCGSGQVNATYNNPPGQPSASVIVGSASVSGFNNNSSTCQ